MDNLVGYLLKENYFKNALKKPIEYTRVLEYSKMRKNTYFISDKDNFQINTHCNSNGK